MWYEIARPNSFIHRSGGSVKKSSTGNTPGECKLMAFYEASSAGDLKDCRSALESLHCVEGSHTLCPITCLSKTWDATSHTSTDAGVLVLDMGLRMNCVPASGSWDLIVIVLDLLDKDELKYTESARADEGTRAQTEDQSPTKNSRTSVCWLCSSRCSQAFLKGQANHNGRQRCSYQSVFWSKTITCNM